MKSNFCHLLIVLAFTAFSVTSFADEGFYCVSSELCKPSGKVVPQAEQHILSTVQIRSKLKNDYTGWKPPKIVDNNWVVEGSWTWSSSLDCLDPHQRFFPYNMEGCEYFDKFGKPPVVLPIDFEATGTFVNKSKGYVLTNEHVVAVCHPFANERESFFCPAIEVKYWVRENKRLKQVKLEGAFIKHMTSEDERNGMDLALLELPVRPPATVSISVVPPQVDDKLQVIGFPMFSKRPHLDLQSNNYNDADGSLRVALGIAVDPDKEGVDLSDENPKDVANMLFSDVDVIPGFSGSMTLNKNGMLVGLAKRGTVQGPSVGLNSNTRYVHDKKNPVWHVRSDVVCDYFRRKALSDLIEGCETQHFDLQTVHRFFDAFKGWSMYAPIPGDPVENEPHTKSLPSWILTDFQKIEKEVFGKTGVLSLQTCSSCEMQADSHRKIIFVNPEFLERLANNKALKDSKQVARFALAHEISHYIYESAVFSHFPKGKSLLGNSSLYGGSSISSDDPQEMERLRKIVMTEGARGHAEVDLYGAVLTDRVFGPSFLSDTLVYFEDIQAKEGHDPAANEHMAARLNAINWYMSNRLK